MRLATVVHGNEETAALIVNNNPVLVKDINRSFGTNWETNLLLLIEKGQLTNLNQWVSRQKPTALQKLTVTEPVTYGPLYRRPRKIWGIGLNYAEHAGDLDEKTPTQAPASFMKPDTTIIGPGDTIKIPVQSNRTTAEAELGIIIGKPCKNVSVEEAPEYVAGFTSIIDMTAEDILRQNPRYLTRSKSFDTFFSFGPQLITTDEVDDVHSLEVATIINNKVHRKNIVANMTFKPWHLVSFHSQVMTLLPGDIISTGTPGAVVISDGDVVQCQITGFPTLTNPVKDLKVR